MSALPQRRNSANNLPALKLASKSPLNAIAPASAERHRSLSRRASSRPLVVRGTLTRSDGVDPLNRRAYAEDFRLRGFGAGEQVEVNLSSGRFDTYLRLVDARSGRELLHGDDTSRSNQNSRMVFTVKPNTRYLIRVTSFRPGRTGAFTLRVNRFEPPADGYNFFYGNGLTNAAAAVGRATGQAIPAVPLGDNAWNLNMINAPAAWAQGSTGLGTIVAVVDSGVDYNHPDLMRNLWLNPGEIPNNNIDDDRNGFVDDDRGWNFVDNNNEPMDRNGHGTEVAGVIAAGNNGFGSIGVAYNAQIMPVRVSTNSGTPNIAAGIRYAVNNGAKVINLSLGGKPGEGNEPELEAAIAFARQSGVSLVLAAGNERESYGAIQPGEPALFAATNNLGINVGSVDRDRQVTTYSNPAGRLRPTFVVAPGEDVYTTTLNGGYDTVGGTSFAAPHISGIIALMYSANPTLTPAQIAAILTATASSTGVTIAP